MGDLLKADFKRRLNRELSRFDPNDPRQEYHAEIFSQLFLGFPQYKAHVAAYVERNYCFVVNDEDHSHPQALLKILKPEEVKKLNEWILNRKNKASVIRQR
ncbi:MAG: hypothetical protein V3U37_01210 [Nitrospinaceae bacterium]